jgi:hypothetical protein
MVNISELLINVVRENKRKVLRHPGRVETLGPKGKGSGMGAPNSPIADVEPPAERQNLTHAGTGTQRGKPVGLPRSDDRPRPVERGESEPQGTPKGLRVEDGGGSEGRPVMGWIGVEPGGSAVRAAKGRHHPTRKRTDFRLVARHEKARQTALKGEGR